MANGQPNGDSSDREYLQAIHKDAQDALRIAKEAKADNAAALKEISTVRNQLRDLLNWLRGNPEIDASDTGAIGIIRKDIKLSFDRHNREDAERWRLHNKDQLARDDDENDRERKDTEGVRYRRNFWVGVCGVLVAIIIGVAALVR